MFVSSPSLSCPAPSEVASVCSACLFPPLTRVPAFVFPSPYAAHQLPTEYSHLGADLHSVTQMCHMNSIPQCTHGHTLKMNQRDIELKRSNSSNK